MRRREFITLLGGAVAAWPLAARAQQPGMPVIGFLGGTSSEVYADRLRAFRQGLKEAGYVDGRNVETEYLWAEGSNDRLPELAAQLVRRQVAVLNVEVGPKRLELLRELLPSATLIAVLVNPTNPTIGEPFVRDLQAAARTLRLKLHVLHASTERDFDTVFATLVQLRADAIVISPDQFLTTRIEQLARLTLRHGIPAISQLRQFAAAGGLMSYGSSETEYYRPVGIYTGRILNGEKPADLPVQRSSKVELIINLKTATTLGLTFPLPLLGRADEVIE
jgi:putative ABC transport system substrate-binding protein